MFQLGKLTFDVKSARISGAYYEPSINQRAGSGNAEYACSNTKKLREGKSRF